jgi:excinuclease UvrABC nuclease subunit
MKLAGFDNHSEFVRGGVYALCLHGEVIYIGKAKSFLARIYSHRSVWSKTRSGQKIPSWLETTCRGMLFDEIHLRPCSADKADAIEREMIELYKPKYNTRLKSPAKVALPPLLLRGRMIDVRPAPDPVFERRV